MSHHYYCFNLFNRNETCYAYLFFIWVYSSIFYFLAFSKIFLVWEKMMKNLHGKQNKMNFWVNLWYQIILQLSSSWLICGFLFCFLLLNPSNKFDFFILSVIFCFLFCYVLTFACVPCAVFQDWRRIWSNIPRQD